MTGSVEHPDVVPYAQYELLPAEQRADIERHLSDCGECRDLVVFVRKTNGTLRYEGRLSRVAKALRMSVEELEAEIRLGTRIGALINRPPDSPVRKSTQPVQPPRSPAKK